MIYKEIEVSKKRWAAYAAAGLAVSYCGVSSAEAEITHFVIGSPIGDQMTDSYNLFNLDPDGTAALAVPHANAFGVNLTRVAVLENQPTQITTTYGSMYQVYDVAGSVAGFSNTFINNNTGNEVARGYASNFVTSGGGPQNRLVNSQNFLSGSLYLVTPSPPNGNLSEAEDQFRDTDGFFGFSFDIGKGGLQYGWGRVSSLTSFVDSGAGSRFTLQEYAFSDTPGEQIRFGQTTSVPEPTSLGVLALGALGVLSTRRRRKVTA